MKKFEYKIITISVSHFKSENFQTELNDKFEKWGNEGWDLIKMEAISTGGVIFQGATTKEFLTVFKRDKIEL